MGRAGLSAGHDLAGRQPGSAGRPARTPPAEAGGHRLLHRGVGRLRGRAVAGLAGRGTGRAGPGRGGDDGLVAGLRGRTGGQDRAGRVMGMLGAMSAAGTALGPSLGGLLLEAYGWRALFLALLPPGALALGLAWRYLPAGGAPANRPRFDGGHGPAGGDLAGLCAGDDAGARPCRLVQSGVAVPGRGGRVAISLDRGARGRAADPAGAAANPRCGWAARPMRWCPR